MQQTERTAHVYRGQEPPTLEQALNYQTNESTRGIRMVAFRDLPDERLRDIVAWAEQYTRTYGTLGWAWHRGECARLALEARGRITP